MNDAELIAFLANAITVRAMCARFKITKPTAQTWLARLVTEQGIKLEMGAVREGKRGPPSKTYRIQPQTAAQVTK